jgi:hypothetical protein
MNGAVALIAKEDTYWGTSGILVCSAWEPEQRVLRERLSGELSFCLLGVGSFAAASCLSGRLAESRCRGHALPREVWFVGTAGLLLPSGGLRRALPFAVRVASATWFDVLVAQRRSYLTSAQQEEQVLKSLDAGSGGPGLDDPNDVWTLPCRSTWGITLDPSEPTLHQGEGCHLENLEIYGFAKVCKDHGVPWRAFVGVSNWVGEQAHTQWKEHHVAASEMAQALAYAAVFGGGSSSKP